MLEMLKRYWKKSKK